MVQCQWSRKGVWFSLWQVSGLISETECSECLWRTLTQRASVFKQHFKTFKPCAEELWSFYCTIRMRPFVQGFCVLMIKKKRYTGIELIIRIMHHWRTHLVKQFMRLQKANKSSWIYIVFHSFSNETQQYLYHFLTKRIVTILPE